MRKSIARTWGLVLLAALAAAPVCAQSPQVLSGDATRYMAMGDSLAAGYRAQPATQGYAFLLYQTGVFDRMPHTLFNDIAAVGATSGDVLAHQVPLALIPPARGGFAPEYVTLTVGGNDIAAIQRYAATNPSPLALQLFIQLTVQEYRQNLTDILEQLAQHLPGVRIFVSNQYSVPEIEALFPAGAPVLAAFNDTAAAVVGGVPGAYLVDAYQAFLGRTGVFLIERRGASALEVHLTNAGQRVMADAFASVIAANK
jgi:lysophospholipase L1-like esterase